MKHVAPQHLVAVRLYSPLAEKYGSFHQFDVRSPREAIHALDCNHPGFLRDFIKCGSHWVVVDGDLRVGEEAAIFPASREINLVPYVEGNGPVIGILAGAIGPALGIGATAATIISGLIVGALFIGLSILLTPKIKPAPEEKAKDENYAFTGPENVTAQGTAVPLIYGRVHAGSVVISASLEVGTDLSPDVPPPPPSTVAGYTTGTTLIPAGTPIPPGGWPPIVARTIPGVKKGTTVNIVGPLGWNYAGKVTRTSYKQTAQGFVQATESVDTFVGPKVLPGNPTDLNIYAWDRLAGFHIYNATNNVYAGEYVGSGHGGHD